MSLTVLSGKIAKLSQSFPNAMQGAGTNIIGGITGENSFLRNEDMLSIATHLIAFWDGKSSGTKDMIDIAQEKGIPVWIFNY